MGGVQLRPSLGLSLTACVFRTMSVKRYLAVATGVVGANFRVIADFESAAEPNPRETRFDSDSDTRSTAR